MIGFDDILGQKAAVDFLRSACVEDRLPHAMVFAGPSGVGKRSCAMALAAFFLCAKPRRDHACGNCDSCRLIPTGNHPDLHVITKELIRFHDKTGKSKAVNLSIDVIRPELIEPAGRTASMGHGKFFIVEQAELMSPAAQNSLLKTLEEPSGRTAIVLLSDASESLLPTVLSRSQIVRFAALDTKLIRSRLEKQGIEPQIAAEAAELSDGSLGGAMNLIAEGIVPAAAELRKQIDQLLAGRAPADLPAWLKRAADNHAEKALQRDPLGSKESATRAGLDLYLSFIARWLRMRLRQTTDADQLEMLCRAIDAIARCQMYLDANVNVPVALAQLASEWEGEFVSA
jgi:DNA polymerase III delta' subunit